MARSLFLIACVALAGVPVGAGQAGPQGAASQAPKAGLPATAGQQAVHAEQPAPAGRAVAAGSGYAYDPDGRRDPFTSLLQRGADPKANGANRPQGPPGVLIGEATVTGILKDPSGYIAMIEAPDKKTYIVRTGQKMMDGSVKSITADSVVFSQDVTDPLSLVKEREIRKGVRSTERG
jgi:type IV pilus assembly protein PilP